MITETQELSRALDKAAELWPEDRNKRAELLRHIIDQGSMAVNSLAEKKAEKRLQALDQIKGAYTGLWTENWREEMLQEWPA
jgi:hypothetical protein